MRLQEVMFGIVLMVQCWLALLLPESWAAVVMQGPTSTSQAVGKWAEFNCTVACTHSINWYIEGYSGEIANSCNTMQGGMKVCTEVVHQCQDETSTTGYTENLRVMVSEELAGSRIAVQCAGLALSFSTSSCTPIISYSIMAFLTIPEIPTSVPSSSPAICPSTIPEPASQQVVTSTVIETVVVTITPTPVVVTVTRNPLPDAGTSRGTRVGSSRLSQVMMELMSWCVWLLLWFLVL